MEAHLAREVEEIHQFRQASYAQFTVYRGRFRGFPGKPLHLKIVHKNFCIETMDSYTIKDTCNLRPLVVIRKPLPIISRSAPDIRLGSLFHITIDGL